MDFVLFRPEQYHVHNVVVWETLIHLDDRAILQTFTAKRSVHFARARE